MQVVDVVGAPRGVQRRSWRALPPEEKQRRLAGLRHRQQRQIELEVRLLDALR